MFTLKGSFRFDLIIPNDSLTVIPFSCSEKSYEEFDNNVCALNKQLIFFDRQNNNAGMDALASGLIRPVFGRD